MMEIARPFTNTLSLSTSCIKCIWYQSYKHTPTDDMNRTTVVFAGYRFESRCSTGSGFTIAKQFNSHQALAAFLIIRISTLR